MIQTQEEARRHMEKALAGPLSDKVALVREIANMRGEMLRMYLDPATGGLWKQLLTPEVRRAARAEQTTKER